MQNFKRFTIRKKLITANLSLLLIVTTFVTIIISYELQRYEKGRILEELSKQLSELDFLLGDMLTEFDFSPDSYSQLTAYARSAELRITLIDSIGVVLFDSEVRRDSLIHVENHWGRPELQEAIAESVGSDERTSATINIPLFYVATIFSKFRQNDFPVSQVYFLRVAIPLTKVQAVLVEVRWKTAVGAGIVLVLTAFVSLWVSNRLAAPLRELAVSAKAVQQGKLDTHFTKYSDDETGDLADLLNEMVGKLRDDLNKVQKLQTIRSQFLGNVSHELRTPIFTLQGYLETLMDGKISDGEQQLRFIERAYLQAQRLNLLLTDLIDISRIESGEMQMSFRHFSLSAWLEKLVPQFRSEAAERKIILEFNLGKDVDDVEVRGDETRLTQVMSNLINNAMKYNLPNGRVEVGCRIAGEAVEVYVSDTGSGIAEEHIPRLFERFYRVDKQRSRTVGGTGLGLAIVKHIVEAHASSVMVKSRLGEGSTFSFVLKRKS